MAKELIHSERESDEGIRRQLLRAEPFQQRPSKRERYLVVHRHVKADQGPAYVNLLGKKKVEGESLAAAVAATPARDLELSSWAWSFLNLTTRAAFTALLAACFQALPHRLLFFRFFFFFAQSNTFPLLCFLILFCVCPFASMRRVILRQKQKCDKVRLPVLCPPPSNVTFD